MIEFIPTTCYECGSKLKVTTGKNGKYKLVCDNTECGGVAVRKFQKGMLAFEIAGIGPAIFKKLYDAGIRDIVGLLTVTPQELVNSGEFKDGRALEKLMDAISSIKNVKLSAVIESLQFDSVGGTISKQIEKYICELPYDFAGFEYSIREQIENKDSDMMLKIKDTIRELSILPNVNLILPKSETVQTNTENTMKTRIMEMTGSPKEFGFATKNDFVAAVAPFGVIAGTLNKDCDFLVTDDLTSATSKMAKAAKLGVQVVTYGQLIEILKK
jgi:NAD-dependent DNA ligase